MNAEFKKVKLMQQKKPKKQGNFMSKREGCECAS